MSNSSPHLVLSFLLYQASSSPAAAAAAGVVSGGHRGADDECWWPCINIMIDSIIAASNMLTLISLYCC